MATPLFLYPSLTDEIKETIFQAKKYCFSYTDQDGLERELDYDASEVNSSINCLRTDGVWSSDKDNLYVRRVVALKNFRHLFGAEGVACKNARLGLSLVWTSADSRQRGADAIVEFGVSDEQFAGDTDHTFVHGEIDLEFPAARIRGDINLSVVLYIAQAGTPTREEIHLANEEGLVLGSFDTFVLRIDGTGSLFPVFEINKMDEPLWSVRCDWTDPVTDSFADTVSINLNRAHKNFKYIDRTQKTFCAQLLVEVMSAALCCVVEKIRSEKFLDQILSEDEVESGSVGEAVRYFANTLGWDMSAPDRLSSSTRKFFDERVAD